MLIKTKNTYRLIFHFCLIGSDLNDSLYLSSSQETLSFGFLNKFKCKAQSSLFNTETS